MIAAAAVVLSDDVNVPSRCYNMQWYFWYERGALRSCGSSMFAEALAALRHYAGWNHGCGGSFRLQVKRRRHQCAD